MYRLIYEQEGRTWAGFFSNRAAANDAYIALKTAGARNFSAHICTVDVQFEVGGKPYTYFTDTEYATGTIVLVATPDGNKPAIVKRCCWQTKDELKKHAARNGFSFIDYKAVLGRAKLADNGVVERLGQALYGWAHDSQQATKELLVYFARHKNTSDIFLKMVAKYSLRLMDAGCADEEYLFSVLQSMRDGMA